MKKTSQAKKKISWDALRTLRPVVVRNYVLRQEGKKTILAFSPGIRRTINRTGRDIIKMCDGRASIQKIIEKLSTEYKTDTHAVLNDTMGFIFQLTMHGLISFRLADLRKVTRIKKATPSGVIPAPWTCRSERCE